MKLLQKCILFLSFIFLTQCRSCINEVVSPVKNYFYLEYDGTYEPVAYTVDGVDSMAQIKAMYFKEIRLASYLDKNVRRPEPGFIRGNDSIIKVYYGITYSAEEKDKIFWRSTSLEIDSIKNGKSIFKDFTKEIPAFYANWSVVSYNKNQILNLEYEQNNKKYFLKLKSK